MDQPSDTAPSTAAPGFCSISKYRALGSELVVPGLIGFVQAQALDHLDNRFPRGDQRLLADLLHGNKPASFVGVQ
jgi:hypothetical protein